MYAALADLLFSLTICPNALPLPAASTLTKASLLISTSSLYIECGLDCGVLTCFVLERNKVLKYVAHLTCRTSQGQSNAIFVKNFERIMVINYHFNLKTNKQKLQERSRE